MGSRRWPFFHVVSVVVILILVMGSLAPPSLAQEPGQGGESGPAPPGPQGPQGTQVFFGVADPDAIPRGACATLHWEVLPPGEWQASLDGQRVDPAAGVRVCPEETRTYRLVVEGPGGRFEKELTLRVVAVGGEAIRPEGEKLTQGQPVAIEFLAVPPNIPRGACAQLVWVVTPPDDWPVMVDGEKVAHNGQKQVCPQNSRAYELLAEAPGGPRTSVVTVQVMVKELPPQPPAPGPGPQPTAAGVSADVTPTDLYADNQPQGTMWARITNNGHGTLTDQQVTVSGTGTATPRSGGNAVPLSYPATQVSLNIAPGQTQAFSLGWPIDTSTYAYAFTVQVQAVDFTDPNTGNNSYSEQVVPTGPAGGGPQPPQPPQPPPSKPKPGGPPGSDLAVTDLYPQKLPQGKIWTRITNNGLAALNNAQVALKCGGLGHDASGKVAWSAVEAPKPKTLSLQAGQTVALETDISVDTNLYSYDLWCSVWPKGFNDPDTANNRYSEKFARAGLPPVPAQPAPPSGPNITKTLTIFADVQPVSLMAAYGTFWVRIKNNGPVKLGKNKADWSLGFTAYSLSTGQQAWGGANTGSFALDIPSGQTQDLDTGIKADVVNYRYDLQVTITPTDFTDPNMGNNKYSQKIPK